MNDDDDDYLHNLQMLMLKLQCSVTTVCNTQIYHYTNKSRIKMHFHLTHFPIKGQTFCELFL